MISSNECWSHGMANQFPKFRVKLSLFRMVALSFHELEVTVDHWELAKDLERRTKIR
jgi:hypothetical protein